MACVRATGEGPWGVGHRASRPRTSGDSGVRLRQRSSTRRSGDGSRNEGGGGGVGGGGGNPRDRYSAPPTTDRQFPPHSCTSATYQHGCCGTSRITLRLSKNGSTLEIEKCDFHPNLKSCQHCSPEVAAVSDSLNADVPLRTQSAPNLTAIPSDGYSYPPPVPPRLTSGHAVDSEPRPPPLPPRDFGGGFGQQAVSVERVDSSRPGSVGTTTKVDVDVESLCPSYPSSLDHDLHDGVGVHAERDFDMPGNECSAHDSIEVHTDRQNEHNHYGLRNGALSARMENYPSRDAQNVNFSLRRPYDKSIDETAIAIQQAQSNKSLPNHRIATGVVDLSAFYSTSLDMFGEDFDVECPSSQSQRLLRRVQDRAGDAACWNMGQAGTGHPSSGRRCHGDETVISGATNLRHDIDKSAVTNGASECFDNRVLARGATDYRIRMLGAGGGEVTSHLADARGANGSLVTAAGVNHNRSQVVLGVSSQMAVGASVNGSLTLGASDSHVKSGAHGSPMRLSANGISCSQMTAGADDSRMAVSSAGVMGTVVKWDRQSDESTDTGCESDEEGDRSKLLARLEMAPAYVHADFKNGEVTSGQPESYL